MAPFLEIPSKEPSSSSPLEWAENILLLEARKTRERLERRGEETDGAEEGEGCCAGIEEEGAEEAETNFRRQLIGQRLGAQATR